MRRVTLWLTASAVLLWASQAMAVPCDDTTPCEDGMSHNEIEEATPSDLAAGCDVLLNAMVARANV